MGISRKAITSYLVSLYCSLAVLTEDAIGAVSYTHLDVYKRQGCASLVRTQGQ